MVYVTHDQEEAMTLGTRVAVMKDGVLQQTGTPLEVFTRPVNMFVARFVGSPAMNFVRAGLVGGGRAELGGSRRMLTARSDDESGRAVLGVRPHDISLVSVGNVDADMRGVIDSVEHLGNSQLVHVAIQANDGTGRLAAPRAAGERRRPEQPDAADLIRVVVPGDAVVSRDEVVWLHFRRDRVHVFDEQTGLRVD